MQDFQCETLLYAACIGLALSKTVKIKELNPILWVAILATTQDINQQKRDEAIQLVNGGIVVGTFNSKKFKEIK